MNPATIIVWLLTSFLAPRHVKITDVGTILKPGTCVSRCDQLGARDAFLFKSGDTYLLHYDGEGPAGWLSTRASSRDLTNWTVDGPVLSLGKAGEPDSASASYGTVFHTGRGWTMLYLATEKATSDQFHVPSLPYNTMSATAASPRGPWVKTGRTVLTSAPGTYYSVTASPGQVIQYRGQLLQFFSATSQVNGRLARTLSIARPAGDRWVPADAPILPATEQIENSSLVYDSASSLWFLFTNHVASRDGLEYTDSIVVYWTADPTSWSVSRKAIVLDQATSKTGRPCIGLPSVLQVGDRLAMVYDSATRITHNGRDLGLAWISLTDLREVTK